MKTTTMDKIIITIYSLAIVFTILFIAHEYGRKSLCTEIGGMYSMDFSRCLPTQKQVEIK